MTLHCCDGVQTRLGDDFRQLTYHSRPSLPFVLAAAVDVCDSPSSFAAVHEAQFESEIKSIIFF